MTRTVMPVKLLDPQMLRLINNMVVVILLTAKTRIRTIIMAIEKSDSQEALAQSSEKTRKPLEEIGICVLQPP